MKTASKVKLTIYGVILLFAVYYFLVPKLFSNQNFQFIFQNDSKPLEKIVTKDLENHTGNYAVVVKSLNSDEQYSLNENEPFLAASLYKLILLAAVYQDIEQGKLKPDDKLTASKDHLSEVLGSVDFGYEEAEDQIERTVEEALQRVATISDNFAAIMLTEKIRGKSSLNYHSTDADPLAKMAVKLGMNNTFFKDEGTETTAKDISIYFEKLYKGEVVSKTSSEKIVVLLSKSKINNRIPSGILSQYQEASQAPKIAHKTGELSRVRHDAGIIYLEGNPYLLVLLSKNLKYEDDGIEVESQISKDIFDYFKNK